MRITDFKNIYFTCTGNTCRSPLAERIFKEELLNLGIGSINVNSRKSQVTKPIDPIYQQYYDLDAGCDFISPDKIISYGTGTMILKYFGDYKFVENHKAKSFSTEELEDASIVLTMSKEHKEDLLENKEALTADGRVKIFTLGEAIGHPDEKVTDPLPAKRSDGQEEEFDFYPYERTYSQLSDMIDQLLIKDIPAMKTLSATVLEHLVEKNHRIHSLKQQPKAPATPTVTMSSLEYGMYPYPMTDISGKVKGAAALKKEIDENYHFDKKYIPTYLARTVDKLRIFYKDIQQHPEDKHQLKKYNGIIGDTIDSLLHIEQKIMKGKYDIASEEIPQCKAIDGDRIGLDIEKSVNIIIPTIVKRLIINDRDKAFSGYCALEAVMNIANRQCDYSTIERINDYTINELHKQK